MAKAVATQNGILIGTVEKATLKEGTNKDKTKKCFDFKWTVKEKDSGVMVFVGKKFWLDENDKLNSNVVEIFENLKSDVTTFNEAKGTMVEVKWYPTKDKKTKEFKQYSWLTISDEGFINLEATPKIIDEDVYNGLETKITARMFVSDIDDKNVKLTDGNAEYEKILPIVIPDRYAEQLSTLVTGYGYEFSLKLVRGGKAGIKEGQFNIDSDESNNADFDPNYLEIVGAGKVKDMVLEEFSKTDAVDLI